MPAANSQRTVQLRVALIAAIATFVIHLIGNPHFGYFRDELYFIICGQHPQWGYVDQPPIAPLLAAASQVFGHSLVLLRAIPALFAAGGVYVTCLLVLEFGGGVFAEVMAALTVFFAPVLMNFGMKVSPDMVGLWLWPLLALYLVGLTKGTDRRWWIAIGAILGICILSKYSVLFFAVALLIGLALTPERRILFSRWFVASIVVAGLIALPDFLWQAHYRYPMLEILRNVQQGKNVILGPLQYVFAEIAITGLLFAVVWLVGLVWLLWTARFRFLGYAFVVLIALMIAFHGKHYYPADVYPYLMAAGGVVIERWTRASRLAQAAVITITVLLGITLTPFAMPVLPEPRMAAYTRSVREVLHISDKATATEHQEQGELEPDWTGMHGWPELAAAVGRVYESLPAADRAQTIIFAQNYSEAGAIELFGKHLPRVISSHNSYYLWGPGTQTNMLICVGGNCDRVARLFSSCDLADTFSERWIDGWLDGTPIVVCRGVKTPLADAWPTLKYYE